MIYTLADILTDEPKPKPEKADDTRFIKSDGYIYKNAAEKELQAEREYYGKAINEMSPEELQNNRIKTHEGAFILPPDVFDALYGYVEPKRSGSVDETERNNEETAIPEIKIEAERKPQFQELQDIINTRSQIPITDNLSEMPYSSDNLSVTPVDNTYVDPNYLIDKELKRINENLNSTYIDEVINKKKPHTTIFGQVDSEGKPIDNLQQQVDNTYGAEYRNQVEEAHKKYDQLPWYIQILPEEDKLKYLGVNAITPGFAEAGNTMFGLVNAMHNIGAHVLNSGKDAYDYFIGQKPMNEINNNADLTLYPEFKTKSENTSEALDLLGGTAANLIPLQAAMNTAGTVFKSISNPVVRNIVTHAVGFVLPKLAENTDRLISGDITPQDYAANLLTEGGMGAVFGAIDSPGLSGIFKTDGAKILAKTIFPTMIPVASELLIKQKLPEAKDILSNFAFNLAFAMHGATGDERTELMNRIKELPPNEQTLEKISEIVNKIKENTGKAYDKTAEYLYDIKPGETSGTLGAFGGLTGRGENKNSTSNKIDFIETKNDEIQKGIETKEKKIDEYKKYIDDTKAELNKFEDRIQSGDELNANEISTVEGMKRNITKTERFISDLGNEIDDYKNDRTLLEQSTEKQKNGNEIYLSKLDKDLNDISDKYDSETISGVKSVESIYNKVKRKNETNPDYNTDSIKDGVRGTVIVKDVNDIPGVLQVLKDKGYEIEANIEKPLNEFGYKGINTNADLGDGYKGEVQVHTPESWKIKKESDKIYEKWRDKDSNDLTLEQSKDRYNEIIYFRDAYDKLFGKFPEDLRDKISSFDKRGESQIVPQDNLPTDPQDSPPSNERNILPSDAHNTNEPSSNLYPNGNLIDSDISNNLSVNKDNNKSDKSQEGNNRDKNDTGGAENNSDESGKAQERTNVFGKFWEGDVKPHAKNEMRSVKDMCKGLINMLAPTAGVNKKVLDIASEMKGTREYETAKMSAALDEIHKGFEKMSLPDRIQFIDRMKQGISQKNDGLNEIARMFKQIDDDLYKQVQQYKPDLNYVENHFRLFWERGSEEELQRIMKKSLQGSKGFMKSMKFETMSEGIFAGLKPRSTNPAELFLWHYNDVLKYLTARRMFAAMKKAGTAEFVRQGKEPPVGMEKVDDKISKVYFPKETDPAGEYYFDSGAARLINNYLSRDYLRHVYDDEGAFKKVMGSLGSTMLKVKNVYTAIELGASPFHAVFETVEAMGSTIGLGIRKFFNGLLKGDLFMVKDGIKDISTFPIEPVKLAREGGNVVRYIKDPEEFIKTSRGKSFLKEYPEAESLIKDLFYGGGKLKMDESYQIGAYENMKRNFRDGNYIGAMMRAIPGGSEMIMKPLFELYIPRLKLGMFLKEYSYELALREKELAKGNVTRGELARKVWNFTEDRFGEMNFDNLWWDRTFKTGLQILFRSITWKLGNLRAFTGAPLEQATEIYNAIKQKRMPQLEPKMGWLMGMSTLTAALGSTIMYSTTGQYPQQLTDYIFPRIDKNDPEQRISVPSYWKDIIHLAHKPSGYVSSSLSGIWGKAVQLMRNRDYYGTEITNDEDGTGKKLWDMFKYIVPKPFSVSGFMDAQKKGAPFIQSLAGFTGFSKAPSYIGRSKIDNMIYDAYADINDDKTMSRDEAAKKEYKNNIKQVLKNGDKEEAFRLINEGIQQGILTSKSAENMIEGVNTDKAVVLFRFLTPEVQEKIIKEMGPDSLKRFGPSIKQKLMERLEEINPHAGEYLNSNPEIKGQVKLKALQDEQKKINDLLKYTDENKREELKDRLYEIKDQMKDIKDEDWYIEKKNETNEKRRKRREERE